MEYTKIITKLNKLKVLAERGDNHERQSAAKKLAILLVKYGINESEIENPDIKLRLFRYRKSDDFRRILCQTIWSVLSNAKIMVHKYNKQVFCDMDYSQYIEVMAKYKFFSKLYEYQKKSFLTAFILKNELFSKESNGKKSKMDDINEEQFIEINRMMFGMKRGSYIETKKQIELQKKEASRPLSK